MPLVLRAKCLIVGDSTVGKTALVQSLISDGTQYAKTYSMTTGVEICVKAIQIPGTDVTVELYIHDCAGKEMFYTYVQQFWDNLGAIMIVYDVSKEDTFKSCAKWLNRVEAEKFSPDTFLPGVLVANKIDLEFQRAIDTKTGEEFASNNSLLYFECSTKKQENYDKPFQALADKFYKHYQAKVDAIEQR